MTKGQVDPHSHPRSTPRSLLFSGTVVANGGDRAIVEAQLAALETGSAQVTVELADTLPAVAKRLIPTCQPVARAYGQLFQAPGDSRPARFANRLSPHRVLIAASIFGRTQALARLMCTRLEFEVLKRISQYDGVIYVGGTSLIESYSLRPKLFELQVAHALGVPFTLMTQSLGPFTQPETKKAIRNITDTAAAILLRDERSRSHLVDIGAGVQHVTVLPDIVFSMADVQSINAITNRKLPPSALKVGISVRELGNYKNYAATGADKRFDDAIVALVVALVADGHQITFISTCQGVPEYWTDDSQKAQQICDQLPPHVANAVTVDSQCRTTSELRRELSSYDMVIATRLHAAILALTAGTVVLPVAYEFKTFDVFKSLGHREWVIDATDCTGRDFVRSFRLFRDTVDDARAELAGMISDIAEQSRQAGSLTWRAIDETIVSHASNRP